MAKKKTMTFEKIEDWLLLYKWFQLQPPETQEKFRQEIIRQQRKSALKMIKKILNYLNHNGKR